MRTIKDKDFIYLSENPLRNLPALVQAVKEEAQEIKKRIELGLNKKSRQFKDKKGYYKF